MSANKLPFGIPQEMVDSIVDFLDHPEDLRSCALTSHAFKPRAQFRLFHDITISLTCAPGSTGDTQPHRDCERLAALLVDAPHLKQNIRRMQLPLCENALEQVLAMALPRLWHIELFQCLEHRLPAPAGATLTFELAHRLVSLPSMRHVHFHGPYWAWERSSARMKALSSMFKTPILHIESITMVGQIRSSPHPNEVEKSVELPSSPRAECAKLKTMRVLWSSLMADYLVHPQCPFDLSQLEELEICEYSEAMGRALRTCRFSVRSLKCSAGKRVFIVCASFHSHVCLKANSASFLSKISRRRLVCKSLLLGIQSPSSKMHWPQSQAKTVSRLSCYSSRVTAATSITGTD
ncbi:hypothetical protein C8R43DRAFT_1022734 [Mycena crocata]|nr:hypothetical protein C8R43DRAFT_1022734 [Mycena crocata]